jgi:hypothetical protein
MRFAVPLLLAAALLSGCTDSDDEPSTPDDGMMPEAMSAPVDIVFAGSLIGLDTVTGAAMPCALGAMQCTTHAVTVPDGPWIVTFTLTMEDGTVTGTGVPYATDYDLFVDGVGESTNPAGEEDVVSKKLDGGTYNAQVVAWHDIDGAYTLTVTFAVPAAA